MGEYLARLGYRVRVPLLPGHGTRWRDMMRTRYRDWRAEVSHVLDDLLETCDCVVLVGISMGGTLVLDLASERTDVAGVVSINPAILDRPGVLARLAPLLQAVIPAVPAAIAGLVTNDAAKPGVDERAYGWLPSRAAGSFLAELPRIRAGLRQLRAPVLIAYSPQDHSVAPANALAIPQLTDATVSLLRLERSFHLATLDYDQELLQQRVGDFVAQVRESSSAAVGGPSC